MKPPAGARGGDTSATGGTTPLPQRINTASVSPGELESLIRDLPRRGTLVKDRGYRQIWRVVVDDEPLYVKFYPRTDLRDRLRRIARGSPALAELRRLELLEKAGIPAVRAVGGLVGSRIDGRVGDVVVLHGIEPHRTVLDHLIAAEPEGLSRAEHYELAGQITGLVHRLGSAGLGHEDLHLGNFLMSRGKIYLLDGYAVVAGGMKHKHLFNLAHSAAPFATRQDMIRTWQRLVEDEPLPKRNAASRGFWKTSEKRVTGENRYFGTIRVGRWGGVFTRRSDRPRAWSLASTCEFDTPDWQAALPRLLDDIAADRLEVVKRSASGDVLSTRLTVAGREIDLIVKRPRRRYWYRYINEIGRGSRARRTWHKAWRVLFRDMPTAWPLALLEQRRLGYVTDQLLLLERVPGQTLDRVDLDALDPADRSTLFHRAGRLLRRIEKLGWSHFDAKSSNWIVHRPDTPARLPPMPVMIDIDGIRRRRWEALGIERLLRSLREHPQYTPADSLALCQGYAPFTPITTARPAKGTGDEGEPEENPPTDGPNDDPPGRRRT